MGSNGRQDSTAASAGQVELPQLAVADVTPEVFRLVLEFMYSGSVQILAPQWLKASGAEQLFEAAERYLLPLLKVSMWFATIPASDATSEDVARQQMPQVTAKILSMLHVHWAHAAVGMCAALLLCSISIRASEDDGMSRLMFDAARGGRAYSGCLRCWRKLHGPLMPSAAGC